MSKCPCNEHHLPLRASVRAAWIRHAEATCAAAHGCKTCVQNYVDKGGSVVDGKRIGVWDGPPEDPGYSVWKATYEKQNRETIAAQEEVRRYLMELEGAAVAIDQWLSAHDDHKRLRDRRDQLLKELSQEPKSVSNIEADGADGPASEAVDGRRLDAGGMPAEADQGEQSKWWGYGKVKADKGSATWSTPEWQRCESRTSASTSSDEWRGNPYGGSSSSSSWSQWDDDQRSSQSAMEETSFESFLAACRIGDMEKVKLAVEQDKDLLFRQEWKHIGWGWIEMRGEDYAVLGRFEGYPCMQLCAFLRRERLDVLKCARISRDPDVAL